VTVNKLVENVRSLLEKNEVEFEIIPHNGIHGKQSEKAAEIHGVGIEAVLKTLIFKCKNKSFVCATITGNQKVDVKKLRGNVGSKIDRLATPPEIKELTGHPVGGVPPVGLPKIIPCIIDMEVSNQIWVFSSAGSPYVGLKMRSKDLLRITGAIVADITTE